MKRLNNSPVAPLLQALCDFLGHSPQVKLADLLPAPWLAKVELSASSDVFPTRPWPFVRPMHAP